MRTAILSACGLVLAVTAIAGAQAAGPQTAGQPTPAPAGRGRGQATAPPAINWPSPPLPEGPLTVDTALVRPIRISITKGLTQPWSMVFVPDAGGGFTILVTERGGRLRTIRNGVLDPNPV